MNPSKFETLVDALLPDASAEELLLSGLCGVIAAEISMKRQEMNMSQKEFAAFMGVSQGLVSRWERGEANFTLGTLVHICAKLGLELQSPIKPAAPKTPYLSAGKLVYLSPACTKWSACSYAEANDFTEPKEM